MFSRRVLKVVPGLSPVGPLAAPAVVLGLVSEAWAAESGAGDANQWFIGLLWLICIAGCG